MEAHIEPGTLAGTTEAIASKSMAHRLLILSSLADAPTELSCNARSQDIDATAACLRSLGASVGETEGGFSVVPLAKSGGARESATLDCRESGSTLRFLVPVVAALGCGATLTGTGRLPHRPLEPLLTQLMAHGCTFFQPELPRVVPLTVGGRLRPGTFSLPGNVSSQFVTGLLMAAPLVAGKVEVYVEEPVESLGYVHLTLEALSAFGCDVDAAHDTIDHTGYLHLTMPPTAHLTSPGTAAVEGDWSNAAFWLVAGALSQDAVTVSGLDTLSSQADRSILAVLAKMGARVGRDDGEAGCRGERLEGCEVDVSAFPDLAAPIAAVAAYADGTTRLANAGRLRIKESNRMETIAATVIAMGGHARIEGDDLVIVGSPHLAGGRVSAAGDHRIAMMAAVMATRADGPTHILGAECVEKSYPAFFEDLARLGGHVTTI